MSIRFASAASVVALAACFAAPAVASEADVAIVGPAAETETEITVAETAALTPAIAPIALADAMGQEEEDTPAITISGAATIASDYRFRGV